MELHSHIGVIGLGQMGLAMAETLKRAGLHVVGTDVGLDVGLEVVGSVVGLDVVGVVVGV